MRRFFYNLSALSLIGIIAVSCHKDPVNPLPKDIPVTGVSINETSLSMLEGDSESLVATVSPDNATNKKVNWSSSKVSVVSVDQSGRITAEAPGTAVITVTTEDGGKTATCAVSVAVRIYPVNSVSLDMTEVNLSKGGTQTLKATINPFNASNKNVSWSSSDNTVATVSQGGVVKAVSSGLAVITVTTEDGGKKAACRVTVLSDNNLEDPTDGGEEWKWD